MGGRSCAFQCRSILQRPSQGRSGIRLFCSRCSLFRVLLSTCSDMDPRCYVFNMHLLRMSARHQSDPLSGAFCMP